MVSVGDKILIVVTGPHGCGLVEAVVSHVSGDGKCFSGDGTYSVSDEGLTWTRGHDRSSVAAEALLVAAALAR